MRDKLGRLAKGITEIEAPVIEITPMSVSDAFVIGRDSSFTIELLSTNGLSIKGLLFTDEPRISTDSRSFSGRRIHITFHIDTDGILPETVKTGKIAFITNGGEFLIPYRFEFFANIHDAQEDEAVLLEGAEWIRENPLKFHAVAPLTPAEEPDEEYQTLCDSIPEDEALFSAILTALIRAEERSPLAFAMYKEAIARGMNITKLYESYVHAFPDGLDEPMPKEVLLYFSYERGADQSILIKLYKNIIQHVDKDTEIYAEYESEIGNYTINCAKERRIDPDLAVLYERMIVTDIIDQKAAAILPDLFKCRRIDIIEGEAEYLAVRYHGMKSCMKSRIIDRTAFVPVYFKDAQLQFFARADLADDVTASIRFTSAELINAPDVLRRCFEINPDHEMLLLSAAREISERGIASENEKQIVIRAMEELEITPDFRSVLIDMLIDLEEKRGEDAEAGCGWFGILHKEDYKTASGNRLFGLFVKNGEIRKALDVLGISGYENVDTSDLSKLICGMIDQGMIPKQDGSISPYFIGLCKYLYDNAMGGQSLIRFLTREYEGASEEMYSLMKRASADEIELYDLPEKILTAKLFANSYAHLDETFEAYIGHCKYSDLVMRAYFSVRCTETFLHDNLLKGFLYEALNSYCKAVEEPLDLPLIYQLAITRYYSEQEELDEKELAICQKLTDALINQGLVFCYTKQLRKKIRIPNEITGRFYVEYHASTDAAPKMFARIVPDDEEYHGVDMQRIYKNIYVMSTVLFKDDELQYMIYDNAFEKKPAEEGFISVKKYHKHSDETFDDLNRLNKAIEDKDIEVMKDIMLTAVERQEVYRELFKLEK